METEDQQSYGDLLATAGNLAAGGALDAVSNQAPGIAYAAGQNAAQGVLDTISPYVPFLLVGALALVLLSGR